MPAFAPGARPSQFRICHASGGNSWALLTNGWTPTFSGDSACDLAFRHVQCGGLFANPVVDTDCPDPGVLQVVLGVDAAPQVAVGDDAVDSFVSADVLAQSCDRLVADHARSLPPRMQIAVVVLEIASGDIFRVGQELILFEALDPGADVSLVTGLDGVARVEHDHDHGGWMVRLVDGAAAQEVLARVVAAVPVARIELHRPSLEDVFISNVRNDRNGRGKQGK